MDNKTNNGYGKPNFRNEGANVVASESAKKGIVESAKSFACSNPGKWVIGATITAGVAFIGYKVYNYFKSSGKQIADAPETEGDNNE